VAPDAHEYEERVTLVELIDDDVSSFDVMMLTCSALQPLV